jgi:pilus assembly protein CpaF
MNLLLEQKRVSDRARAAFGSRSRPAPGLSAPHTRVTVRAILADPSPIAERSRPDGRALPPDRSLLTERSPLTERSQKIARTLIAERSTSIARSLLAEKSQPVPRPLLIERYRDRALCCSGEGSSGEGGSGRGGRGEGGASMSSLVPAVPVAPLRIDTASRFGDLGPYLLLDDVTDIVITGSSGAWVDRGGGFERIDEWSGGHEVVHRLAVRLIAEGGRHVDEVSPFVDVRLPGGIRVHAVLPPLSVGGAALSIRVPAQRPLLLEHLQARGMFAPRGDALSQRLREAVSSRTNVLISGGAGTGKTTLLAALLSHADPSERIICVEDVSELVVDHPHVVSLEARQPNAEGSGGVDIARLLRESLRMRPDRLVLGECRGSEIRDMLGALNTGHEGGACTVHANSLTDVPARLESLGALAGLSSEAVARQAVSAIGLVIHLQRVRGIRRVAALGRFTRDERGRLTIAPEVSS